MVGKRKRPAAVTATPEQFDVQTTSLGSSVVDPSDDSMSLSMTEVEVKKPFSFKDPKFEAAKCSVSAKKSRTWKTLKQIISAEKTSTSSACQEVVTYISIDAPVSFKPVKKYSDISGLPAPYTDPTTKLRYATAEEYSRVRMLPTDIVSGLLLLRKAPMPST